MLNLFFLRATFHSDAKLPVLGLEKLLISFRAWGRQKAFCCGSELEQLRLTVLTFDQVKNCRLSVSSITRLWEILH